MKVSQMHNFNTKWLQLPAMVALSLGSLTLLSLTACSDKTAQKTADDVAAIRAIKEAEQANTNKQKQSDKQYTDGIVSGSAAPVKQYKH
jgi:hypothetical protein